MLTENDFSENIFLENDIVALRPISEADADGFKKFIYDERIWDFYIMKISSEEDVIRFIGSSIKSREKALRYGFTITEKKTGEIAGSMSFLNFSFHDKRVEIGGSFVNPEKRGTGINQAAKILMLGYAFEVLDFERVEFKTDYYNAPARGGLEKLGARYEGALRSHTVMHDGRRRDTLYYSVLKSEFEVVKKIYSLNTASFNK